MIPRFRRPLTAGIATDPPDDGTPSVRHAADRYRRPDASHECIGGGYGRGGHSEPPVRSATQRSTYTLTASPLR